jgi:hypothetical protein
LARANPPWRGAANESLGIIQPIDFGEVRSLDFSTLTGYYWKCRDILQSSTSLKKGLCKPYKFLNMLNPPLIEHELILCIHSTYSDEIPMPLLFTVSRA